MRKIKICVITTISFTMEMFVLEMAEYLANTDEFEVTLVCNNDNEFEKKLPKNLRYISVKMNRGINFKSFTAIIQMLKIFRNERFDIIQYSTPNASLYAAIAGKIANIPTRLYCQWGIIYTSFKGLKRALFKFMEKIICYFSTNIEPDSFGNLAFSFEEKLYDSSKAYVVGNGSACGVNLRKFNFYDRKVYREEIRHKLQLKENDYVVGFIGRLTRDKGVNEILSAFKLLDIPNKKMIVIGFEDNIESLNQNIFLWAKKQNDIIFINHTSEVEKYLSAMDVFVLPSYREGFGNVILEAMAMKTPVICTNIPGPTDIVVHELNGLLVEKKDDVNIAKSIELLFNDIELTRKMVENGYKIIYEKYSSNYVFNEIYNDRRRIFFSKK